MSQKFDREGLFRGAVLDGTLGVTQEKGYPQVILKVRADEYFDEVSGEWVPWAEYGMDTVGYMCLIGTDKQGDKFTTFSYDNVKEVFGWAGQSLPELAGILASAAENNVACQFRMVEDTYEQRKHDGFKLQAVYTFDAPPTRELKRLDTDALKDLDAMFAGVLGGSATPSKPVSRKAPATAPKAPGAKKTPADAKGKIAANDAVDEHVARDQAAREAREAAKLAAREARKAAKKTGPPTVAAAPTAVECTQMDAWNALVQVREDNGLEEGTAETAYTESVFEVVGELTSDEQVADITPVQWAEIRQVGMVKMEAYLTD